MRCRVYFTLERWDEAVNECEQAVNLDGQSSVNHLWLGRALGEKADHASFIAAYSLAKRARAEFEQAVNLDPRNGEAHVRSRRVLLFGSGGGGRRYGQGAGAGARSRKIDPARAHILLGRIAESRKDYGTAEREYKQATATSEHPAFSWMSLASFYRKRERWDEMEAAVGSGYRAAQHDRRAGVALYNGASVLSKGKRNLALAAKMLEEYLADYPRTEEGPAFEALHTACTAQRPARRQEWCMAGTGGCT